MEGYERMKKVWMIAAMAVLLFTLVYQGSMAFFHAEKNIGTRISAGTLGTGQSHKKVLENQYR